MPVPRSVSACPLSDPVGMIPSPTGNLQPVDVHTLPLSASTERKKRVNQQFLKEKTNIFFKKQQ